MTKRSSLSILNAAQKIKLSTKDFFNWCDQIPAVFPADFLTLTEEILNWKLDEICLLYLGQSVQELTK